MVGEVRDMHQMDAKLTRKPMRPPITATSCQDEGRKEGDCERSDCKRSDCKRSDCKMHVGQGRSDCRVRGRSVRWGKRCSATSQTRGSKCRANHALLSAYASVAIGRGHSA